MKIDMKFRDENLAMQMRNQQFDSHQRLVNHEPLVVFGNGKKRDAPVIYHRRDNALSVTGLSVGDGPLEGTGPPFVSIPANGTGPPGTGPPGTGPPGTGPADTG